MMNQVQIQELTPAGTETYKVFKIRRKSDGKFSCGGSYPHFNNKGKEWYTLSAVASHLGLNGMGRGYGGYRLELSDLEIVTYEYQVSKFEVGTQALEEYYAGLAKRREKRIAQEQRAKARKRLAQAKREAEAAAERLRRLQEP